MNFNNELKKPLFVTRSNLYNFSVTALNAAIASNSATLSESVRGDAFIKAASAKKLPFVKLGECTQAEIKELVIKRLETDASEKFEFMDGSAYSGAQAAVEVAKESKIGQYFLALEKETLKIAQQAFLDGKIV